MPTLLSPPLGGIVRARRYAALSRVYDVTLGRRFYRQARRTFARLARLYGLQPSAAVDLGAGTGLFAVWLARRYRIPVYAVDVSRAMLQAGSCRMQRAGVIPLHQDIRSLRLPRPVDLAVSNYDTINHLLRPADVRQAFAALASQLLPGGFFLFDVITPAQVPERTLAHHFRSARGTRVMQTVRYEAGPHLLRVTVRIRRPSAPTLIEHHCERTYPLPWLIEWLRTSGFVVRGVHDAHTGAEVGYTLPARVIIAAEKAALDRHRGLRGRA